MPKIYILPELIIYDRKTPSTFKPHTANKYAQKIMRGDESLLNSCSKQDYVLYIDGVEVANKENKSGSSLSDSYYFYGKVNNWGLFSLDITPGKHTIAIKGFQNSYYERESMGHRYVNGEDRPTIHFQEKYVNKKYTFDNQLDFTVSEMAMHIFI